MKTPTILLLSSVMVVIVMCCVMYASMLVLGVTNGALATMLVYWFVLAFDLLFRRLRGVES